MSLTVTQRPSQIITIDVSTWNAVGNPILYKMQRKDFTFASITDSGGFVRLVLDSSFGNVATSFVVGHSVYFITDGGVYDVYGLVTASAYSAPNTLVTLDTAYISSSTGFVNNATLRPSYNVDVQVFNNANVNLSTASFKYTPNSKGNVSIDISAILRANLSPDNNFDLTSATEVFNDTNSNVGFYIKYTEVWTGSTESQTNDSVNVFFAIFGSMQIPSAFGGNIYDYLILSDMKIAEIIISTAQVLTGFATPVTIIAAPGADNIIIPVQFFTFIDFNTVAYATNTGFVLEINGVTVSSSAAGVLAATADAFTIITPLDINVQTELRNQPLKFRVLTGNPTAGNSPVRVVCIYTVRGLA